MSKGFGRLTESEDYSSESIHDIRPTLFRPAWSLSIMRHICLITDLFSKMACLDILALLLLGELISVLYRCI